MLRFFPALYPVKPSQAQPAKPSQDDTRQGKGRYKKEKNLKRREGKEKGRRRKSLNTPLAQPIQFESVA